MGHHGPNNAPLPSRQISLTYIDWLDIFENNVVQLYDVINIQILKILICQWFEQFVPYHLCVLGRGWRVGFFNFGSGSGIGKNYRVGSGLGLGSGIGNIYWINRVSSGIENLDRVFPYFVIFNSWSTWLNIKIGIS